MITDQYRRRPRERERRSRERRSRERERRSRRCLECDLLERERDRDLDRDRERRPEATSWGEGLGAGLFPNNLRAAAAAAFLSRASSSEPEGRVKGAGRLRLTSFGGGAVEAAGGAPATCGLSPPVWNPGEWPCKPPTPAFTQFNACGFCFLWSKPISKVTTSPTTSSSQFCKALTCTKTSPLDWDLRMPKPRQFQ